MTSKIKGTEGVEFPDGTVQSSAAYSKAQSDAVFMDQSEVVALFTGANQSLVGDGYQKLPGGLIAQWGIVEQAGGQATGTQVFPLQFPNAVFSCVLGWQSTTGEGRPFITLLGTYQFEWNRGSTGAGAIHWIAIGY